MLFVHFFFFFAKVDIRKCIIIVSQLVDLFRTPFSSQQFHSNFLQSFFTYLTQRRFAIKVSMYHRQVIVDVIRKKIIEQQAAQSLFGKRVI